MDETTRAGRLRSALEAAAVALEGAHPNELNGQGYRLARDIRAALDETQDDGSASLCEGCRRDETCLGGDCSSNACPSGARAE